MPGFSWYCCIFKPSRESLGEDVFHGYGNLRRWRLKNGTDVLRKRTVGPRERALPEDARVSEKVFSRVPGEEYEEVYEEELEEEPESDSIEE